MKYGKRKRSIDWEKLDSSKFRQNKEEIKTGFLAQCIEGLSQYYGIDYLNMFSRLEAADLTEGYILKYYETLHTESWENIMEELAKILNNRESKNTNKLEYV